MRTAEETGVGLRKIDDIARDAEARNDAMGADEYLRQSYSSCKPTSEFTRLKEEQYLGFFVQQYNEGHGPALVWACHHDRGSGHADFSVYGGSKSYLWDIEVTALFSQPTTKNPKGYEDFSPYPVWRNPSDPSVMFQDIDAPRKSKPYATLNRVVETHLRDKYPPYWLVLYDNEHGVQHPNLNQLEGLIRQILRKKASRSRLPTNLKQVWAFDLPGLVQAWP